MLLDQDGELVVHGLHDLDAAVLADRILEDRIEGLLLRGGGHGQPCAEQRVHELRLALGGAARVEGGVVDVRAALIERGEQEAHLRRADEVVRGQIEEPALVRGIAQRRLAGLDGADAADEERELLKGILGARAVAVVGRYAIVVVGEQDEEVSLHGHAVLHAREQRVHGGIVLERGPAHRHEQPVLIAAHDLLVGERDVDQVLADRAGERLADDGKHILALHERQRADGLGELGDDLALFIDIAAADAHQIALLGPKTAAQLGKILLIHV